MSNERASARMFYMVVCPRKSAGPVDTRNAGERGARLIVLIPMLLEVAKQTTMHSLFDIEALNRLRRDVRYNEPAGRGSVVPLSRPSFGNEFLPGLPVLPPIRQATPAPTGLSHAATENGGKQDQTGNEWDSSG